MVTLCEWNEKEEFDRLGVEDRHHTILGTRIRELRVPVRPGRDMGSIIEMAARNELMRRDGRHSANEFLERIEGHLVPRPAIEQSSESIASPPDPESEEKPQSSSWSALMPQAKGTESSAWVPAARPRKEGDE